MDTPTTHTGEQAHLPIIDLSGDDEARIARKLLEAAAEWGFVYVRGRGLDIDAARIKGVFNLSQRFFASSVSEKEKCRIGPEDRGWSGPGAEFTDEAARKGGDFKEALNLGEFVDGNPQQPIPSALLGHEAEIREFFNLCRGVCLKLYRLFGVALKIPPEHGGKDWFASRHDPRKGPSGSILRLLYYPSLRSSTSNSATTSAAADELRCSAHTDFGGLTLLFQRPGQPGLEVQAPDGAWMPVAVQPPGTADDAYPPVVVNIGDMLSDWTGRVLRSTMHRVVIPKGRTEDRYSVAFFCHPVATTELVPVPSPLIEGRREGGEKVLTAAEHLKKRLAETYGWEK